MLGFRRPAPGTFASAGNRHAPAAGQGGNRFAAWSLRGGDQKHVPDHRRGGRSRARSLPRRCRSSSRPAVARRRRRAPARPRIDERRPPAPVGQRRGLRPATAYPETGEAPCGVAPYTGQLKKITAVDRLTVEFQLCGPDAAFLPKIAFSAFGIQDSDYLDGARAGRSYLDKPNGTGPYKLKEWSKGNRMVFDGLRRLLGRQGPDAEPRVPLERRGRPAPARAPGRHGRRHRQPGHRRHRDDQGRHDLQFNARAGPEHLVPRLQQHDRSRGTT